MKKFLALFLCLLMLASLAVGCSEKEATEDATGIDTFSVGYGRTDISPKSSVPMGGFGDDRVSTMIADPLYACCIAFSDKDTTVLVFTMDLLSSNKELVAAARALIKQEIGIPENCIMITSSHTHSSADLAKTSVPVIAEYIELICAQMLEAAKIALEDRKPATMESTFCRPEQMNYVRHYILDNGTYAGSNFGDFNSGKIIGHRGKADNLMQLLNFKREDAKDIVLINWQGHYRFEKGTIISSDYYGQVRNHLESALDCHAAFVLGPSGNVNTRSLMSSEPSILDYREYGKTLSEYALEAAKDFAPIQTGKIEITENLYTADLAAGGTLEYPLYALSLGDAAFIFAPYEMFDTNGITIRNNSKYHATFLATCANGRFYYVPDMAGFECQSYEASTTRLKAGYGEIFADEYVKMLDDLYTRTGITPTDKVDIYNTQEFVPVSDGAEYTNLKPGDTSAYTATASGAYVITLRGPAGVNKMLVWDAEVRDQILNSTTVKLLFDDFNVIAGIAE